MRSRLAAAVLLVAPAPVLAAEANLCTDYLVRHLGDERALRACMDWLASIQPLSNTVSPEQTTATSSGCETPQVHLFAGSGLAVGNQREPFVAVDQARSLPEGRTFALAVTDSNPSRIIRTYTTDSGVTWNAGTVGAGDGLPTGLADPWAVFTDHGTLFISYLNDGAVPYAPYPAIDMTRATVIAVSDDGGATFDFVDGLGGTPASPQSDRGSLAAGPGGLHGAVWGLVR